MRKAILCALLLAIALSPAATGIGRDQVKVYLTLGPHSGNEGGTQMWRCNIDGTAPELLLEGTLLGPLDVDSVNGILYYGHGCYIWKANLDGSSPTAIGYNGPVYDIGYGFYPFDVNGAYFCSFDEEGFRIETPDGSDYHVYFHQFPGVVSQPVPVGVALHVYTGSGVEAPEHTTWGRVKSTFR